MSKVLSIDLGHKNIHMLAGQYRNFRFEIEKAVTIPTPGISFWDGNIGDAVLLKDSLRKAISKARIKARQVTFTVQSTSVITRDILFPPVPEENIKSMIELEIEQYLPIVASDYVIEFQKIGEVMDGGTKNNKIRVAAMPKKMVEDYMLLVKKLKMKPVSLDIHSNAIAKLFSREIIINNETYKLDHSIAAVDMGAHTIGVSIIANGIAEFNRLISMGGKDIDSKISGDLGVTLDQAESLKIKECALDRENHSAMTAQQVNDSIRLHVDQWINEIQKVLQFFISRNVGNKVTKVFLYGGSANLKGLSQYMGQALSLPVQIIDTIGYVRTGKQVEDFRVEYFVNTIGSLVRNK